MKKKILSTLVSIGMIVGLTPIIAFADETIELEEITPVEETIDEENLKTETIESPIIEIIEENKIEDNNNNLMPTAISPDGKWGWFGYSMNLSNNIGVAYFPGTLDWKIGDDGTIGEGQDNFLQYYANGGENTFRKYVVLNEYISSGDEVTLDTVTPIANPVDKNQTIDFIAWYQKAAADTIGFYNPGESIEIVPGYSTTTTSDNQPNGTNNPADMTKPNVYSVDGFWAIWTTKDITVFYDGTPYTPDITYEYNYNIGNSGENAGDFSSRLRTYLERQQELYINGEQVDITDFATAGDLTLDLTAGQQTNAGTYIFKPKINYQNTNGFEINSHPSTEAELVINSRTVHFTGTVTKEYTGETITANYSGTKDEYTNATNTKGTVTVETAQNGTGDGLMEGDYVVFDTTASGLLPGTYYADNNNISYTIYNSDGQDVTQNYNVTFDFTLVIEGEVPEPPETIEPPDNTDPEPTPDPEPGPTPDNPPVVEPEPEPTPDEPVVDEPTIEEPTNTETNIPNKPVTPKPIKDSLPQTGDNNYVWLFTILASLGFVGLFVARRFE